MKRHPSKSGFTLVEVMVAVGIIMIVLGVVIPNFLTYRSSAHVGSCQANLNLIAHGCEMHYLRTGQVVTDVKSLTDASLGGAVYIKQIPICPVKGEYSITFDQATQRFHVECSAFDDEEHNVHQDGDEGGK